MISRVISHASALVLAAGGLVLLFAPDAVLGCFSPAFPREVLWVGQLLGAAWLGLAALNWIQRRAVLGGTYNRPIVLANVFHYFIGAMVLLKAAQDGAPSSLWVFAVPIVVLAIAYGALLLLGPFDRLR